MMMMPKRRPVSWYAKHPNNTYWRDKADRIWSELVRREWQCCPVCGNANIQAHHLLTKGAYPQYRHELMNGIGLCYTHHTAHVPGHPSAHGSPRAFDDWLKEHYPDRYEWLQQARRRDEKRGLTWKESYEMLKTKEESCFQ
jgi:ribosomal protein S27AE